MASGHLRRADLSPEGLAEISDLLRLVFPEAAHLTPRYLDWWYNGNPYGQAVAYNSYQDGRLVAHVAISPFRARIRGEEERGTLGLHAASHPDVRGTGHYFAVAQRVVEIIHRDHDFCIMVANANTAPIHARKSGFQIVTPLDVKVGLGTAPLALEEGDEEEPEFEPIRTPEYVAWRLGRPDGPYARRRIDDRTTAAYGPAGKAGVYVELGRFPAEEVPAELPRLRALNPVRLWVGLEPSARWRSLRYTDLPDRLRPVPLVFLYLDATGAERELDPGRVRFRAADFDAF